MSGVRWVSLVFYKPYVIAYRRKEIVTDVVFCLPDSLMLMFFLQEHMVENEISILRRVKHKNIVELIEEYETPKEIFLVMELVKVRIKMFSCDQVCILHLITIQSN